MKAGEFILGGMFLVFLALTELASVVILNGRKIPAPGSHQTVDD